MSFPWLDRTPPRQGGSDRRAEVARTELAHRAALLYRLGFSVEDATKRLCDRIAWEYDPTSSKGGAHKRPDGLSDAEIAKIVSETYARRP
ncbi:MAG TPA: hypothetical protein VFQ53_37305 [Kofleriaceae bacterium]|nr:hypothetical protein [Kofleriaceae bacterium]